MCFCYNFFSCVYDNAFVACEEEVVGEEGDLWHGSDFECDVRVVMFHTLNVMLNL
jgi:hypothetical protein